MLANAMSNLCICCDLGTPLLAMSKGCLQKDWFLRESVWTLPNIMKHCLFWAKNMWHNNESLNVKKKMVQQLTCKVHELEPKFPFPLRQHAPTCTNMHQHATITMEIQQYSGYPNNCHDRQIMWHGSPQKWTCILHGHVPTKTRKK